MACEKYQDYKPRHDARVLIDHVNRTIYEFEGFKMTVRQIFYQLLGQNIIKNSTKIYKKIVDVVGKGRKGGFIDWDAIEDRTRTHRVLDHWDSPTELIQDAAKWYRRDWWEGQPYYIEVWTEKDALIGIIKDAAYSLGCSCCSCRGYNSLSEMLAAAQRFIDKEIQGYECIILYLGDHDPSGINMTNDIKKRMELFHANVHVHRLALTMDQVELYNLPPNTAKEKDKRYASYKKLYGTDCWELDALHPQVLHDMITDFIKTYQDQKMFEAVKAQQEAEREQIKELLL